MQSFQRARSTEQREVRREAILGAAFEMLAEMPANRVTMNGLSRRVGLAKSNVMRYFESREAVLLDLLSRLAAEWLVEAKTQVAQHIDRDATLSTRVNAISRLFARLFADHRVLCDLLSAETTVLEHNVSVEVALRYKRGAIRAHEGLSAVIIDAVPELNRELGRDAAFTIIVLAGAMWTHSHPSPAMAAVYREEPELSTVEGFAESLGHMIATYLVGLVTAYTPPQAKPPCGG